MPNLDKVRIPSAVTRKTKLDLSNDHITSMGFGRLQVVNYIHTIKGGSIDCNALATVRPAPLGNPTFGRLRLLTRAFYVPYRLVFPQWDNYYQDTIGSGVGGSSLVVGVPFFKNETLALMFANAYSDIEPFSVQVSDQSAIDAGAYDFTNGSQYFALTEDGRIALKLLHSLGYRFNYDAKDTTKYNAFALLAYARVFVDWYSNQNYLNSADMLALKQLFSNNNPLSSFELDRVVLQLIFRLSAFVMYDSDAYFNAAWDNPTGPISGQFTSGYETVDITSANSQYAAKVQIPSNGTPVMAQAAGSNNIGSQYIHDVLKKLTDYQKRHQLSAALPISRYLAQWGVATDYLSLDRSVYIGAKSQDINIGEVTSYADTDSASLGDFAGKGFGQGQANFQFRADEFGIFLVLASVLPTGGYYQGCDRHNLSYADRFDFFTPELDGLSVQPISPREVYMSNDSNFGSGGVGYENPFGFTGRYGHYKRSLNYFTGDLELPSVALGGDSWHTFRKFGDDSFGGSAAGIRHGLPFTRFEDGKSYNRIFQYTIGDLDAFYVHFHFDTSALFPCRPLYETYEFSDNGPDVTIQNGAVVN